MEELRGSQVTFRRWWVLARLLGNMSLSLPGCCLPEAGRPQVGLQARLPLPSERTKMGSLKERRECEFGEQKAECGFLQKSG